MRFWQCLLFLVFDIPFHYFRSVSLHFSFIAFIRIWLTRMHRNQRNAITARARTRPTSPMAIRLNRWSPLMAWTVLSSQWLWVSPIVRLIMADIKLMIKSIKTRKNERLWSWYDFANAYHWSSLSFCPLTEFRVCLWTSSLPRRPFRSSCQCPKLNAIIMVSPFLSFMISSNDKTIRIPILEQMSPQSSEVSQSQSLSLYSKSPFGLPLGLSGGQSSPAQPESLESDESEGSAPKSPTLPPLSQKIYSSLENQLKSLPYSTVNSHKSVNEQSMPSSLSYGSNDRKYKTSYDLKDQKSIGSQYGRDANTYR